MTNPRFCLYCRKDQPREGFISIPHNNSGTLRGQCLECQRRRALPRETLEEMALRDKKERL